MSGKSAWQQLCEILEQSGAKVTFSINCCSGIVSVIGKRCECWRCRKGRGEEVKPETEDLAASISKEAQVAFRKKVCEEVFGE